MLWSVVYIYVFVSFARNSHKQWRRRRKNASMILVHFENTCKRKSDRRLSAELKRSRIGQETRKSKNLLTCSPSTLMQVKAVVLAAKMLKVRPGFLFLVMRLKRYYYFFQ